MFILAKIIKKLLFRLIAIAGAFSRNKKILII
jgi:hypothetical protein